MTGILGVIAGIALMVVGVLIFGILAKWGFEDNLQFSIIFGGALGFVLFGLNTFANAVFFEPTVPNNTSHHSVTREVRTSTNINHPTYTPTLKPVN